MTGELARRNVVICCDGTSNEPARDQTNVAKLTYAMIKDTERQHVYFQPGLGTRAMGFPMPVGNRSARLAGLAFGYGIKDDLRDAYVFIMNHWRPGDRLFLLGFSRGAYTVRALAALISIYGMPMPGNEALLPYAIDMFWQASGADRARFLTVMELGARYKATLSAGDCRPHFLGVWDTVSSVGWIGSPVALPRTRTNGDIAHIRHAVSLDERRAFFRANLFKPPPDQDCVQVWFPGGHCDVGGGFPEAESGMSKYALAWMAGEAELAGLMIDAQRLVEVLGGDRAGGWAPPSPEARRHDVVPWPWWIAEFLPKVYWDRTTERRTLRCNLFRRRTLGADPLVHPVAWKIPGYERRIPLGAIPCPDATTMPKT